MSTRKSGRSTKRRTMRKAQAPNFLTGDFIDQRWNPFANKRFVNAFLIEMLRRPDLNAIDRASDYEQYVSEWREVRDYYRDAVDGAIGDNESRPPVSVHVLKLLAIGRLFYSGFSDEEWRRVYDLFCGALEDRIDRRVAEEAAAEKAAA